MVSLQVMLFTFSWNKSILICKRNFCNVNDEAISKPKMDCAIKDMKRGKQMCMHILYILS